MDYRHIEVKPVAGALGAEIGGVDLAAPLDDETFAEIRQAFLDHLVIFFRDQDVTPDQHKAFGRRFGTLNVHPYVTPMDGHEEIIEIVKEKDDKVNFGGGWHTDVSFLEKPALGSVLLAREVPESGGDTMIHAYSGRAVCETHLGRWWHTRLAAACRWPACGGSTRSPRPRCGARSASSTPT